MVFSIKREKNDCTSKAPWYCHRSLKKLIQTLKGRRDLFQGHLGTSRERTGWHKQGALSPLAAGSAWGPLPVLEWQQGEAEGWQGCQGVPCRLPAHTERCCQLQAGLAASSHGRAEGKCARQICRFSVGNKRISWFNSQYKVTAQN